MEIKEVKNYEQLSEKYLMRPDAIEDVQDALMIIASNLSDIQVLASADNDIRNFKIDQLKSFIFDVKQVERKNKNYEI
jgi:hypothetical protein